MSVISQLNGFFESILAYPMGWIASSIGHSAYGEGSADVIALKKEILALQAELSRYREVEVNNIQLRGLLKLKQKSRLSIMAARVIAMDGIPWIKSMVLNRGSCDGISGISAAIVGRDLGIKSGIVAGEIVGEVIDVGRHNSRLLLITDYDCRIAAIDQRSRVRGILVGAGHGLCTLKFVQDKSDVKVNDIIVTSGLDGIFPSGFLLGKVVSISPGSAASLFQVVKVKPLIDLDRVRWLGIILKPSSLH